MAWPLKYGLNPYQTAASLEFPTGGGWLRVVNGTLGYINVLDALRAWTLALEVGRAFGRPAAASVKHVQPAGAAVASPLDEAFLRAQFLAADDWSPIATAYARARAGDRVASFGDFIGLSEPVDESAARLIAREVSDGIIAPAYEPDALRTLRGKKRGRYVILEADPSFEPPVAEVRSENGVTLRQARNTLAIGPTAEERRDWIAAFAPVVLSSDGYIPFPDNVDRARGSFIHAIAQPGGSANDDAVTAAADASGMVMIHTGTRLFLH